MSIIGPDELHENVRNLHDEYVDKLRAQRSENLRRIEEMLDLKKLRTSMEKVLSAAIHRSAKSALKRHLQLLDDGEPLEPILGFSVNIGRIARATWDRAPDGLKKSYDADDVTSAMAMLVQKAGYLVDEDAVMSIEIPLVDDEDLDMDDDDEELMALDDAIDDELPGPELGLEE